MGRKDNKKEFVSVNWSNEDIQKAIYTFSQNEEEPGVCIVPPLPPFILFCFVLGCHLTCGKKQVCLKKVLHLLFSFVYSLLSLDSNVILSLIMLSVHSQATGRSYATEKEVLVSSE